MVTSSRTIDRGLLFIRAALGVVFVMHGGQKLFLFGHEGVTGAMAGLGLPVPALSAAAIIAVELGGGIALLSGAFTRVFAFLLAGAMGVATATAHLSNGFFLPAGYEFTLTLLLVSLGVMFTGAGAYSVDALLARTAPETAAPSSKYPAAA
jgi:putative oxidoreductase